MFFFLTKELLYRCYYVILGFFCNFLILFINKKQFFFFLIQPLDNTTINFTWGFAYAEPMETFFTFISLSFVFSCFFSYFFVIIHGLFFLLPGLSRLKYQSIWFIFVWAVLFYFSSFVLCFHYILPSLYIFCFSQEMTNDLFTLSFFPMAYPYVMFSLKVLISSFMIMQLSLLFLIYCILNQKFFPIFIKNKKHIYVVCLFIGTTCSTPELISQIIISGALVMSFECLLYIYCVYVFFSREIA